MNRFLLLIISILYMGSLRVVYRLVNRFQKYTTMVTIILFLTLLVFCWVFYKSIDWFEKI